MGGEIYNKIIYDGSKTEEKLGPNLDVNFIRKLGNNVWHIKDGNLTKYAGDYDYYLEKSGGLSDERAAITT